MERSQNEPLCAFTRLVKYILSIFSPKNLDYSEIIPNFAVDSVSLKRARGSNLLVKGRLRTLSSVVSTSQLETLSEETQPKRLRWVYCTLLQYITAWANSSCLS